MLAACFAAEETEVDDASSFVRRTEFDWDSAGNRTAMRKYTDGLLASTTVYDPASSLNQMTGWWFGNTNAVYLYDANGNRTNKTVTITDYTEQTETTAYGYDEDNRLTSVFDINNAGKTNGYTFAYDYRPRRYYRATPAETNLCVFSDGLAVQEYDAAGTISPLSGIFILTEPLVPGNLSVENIRTAGYGGGVGGMVYSIKNGQLKASHSNHRGDVVAKTDHLGNLSWFARYNAYGTRFHEFGATHDRQRGNTKDEEEPLGFINDGMRPRDLEHGCYFTRDPAGYIDTPNLYLYVRNNPVNLFDPTGLEPKMGTPLLIAWEFILSISARIDDAIQDCTGGYGMDALEMDLIVNGVPYDEMVGAVGVGLVRASKIITKTDKVLDSVDLVSDTSRGLKTAASKGDEAAGVTTKLNKAETPSSVATKATQPSPQQRGRINEAKVLDGIGETKNTQKFKTSQGNTIPDFVNDSQIGEIKDTKRVSNTAQLRAQKEAAQASGREHVTIPGDNTTVSRPATEGTTVVRRDDIGPAPVEDTTTTD